MEWFCLDRNELGRDMGNVKVKHSKGKSGERDTVTLFFDPMNADRATTREFHAIKDKLHNDPSNPKIIIDVGGPKKWGSLKTETSEEYNIPANAITELPAKKPSRSQDAPKMLMIPGADRVIVPEEDSGFNASEALENLGSTRRYIEGLKWREIMRKKMEEGEY
jgi:hypothetical protein